MRRISFGISLAALTAMIPQVIGPIRIGGTGDLGSLIPRRKVHHGWRKGRKTARSLSLARRSNRRKAARKANARRLRHG